jgi:hypothetical protein
MGLFRTTDPVTGVVFRNADWRKEVSFRDRYASFVSGWLPDSEAEQTRERNMLAVWLPLWATESHKRTVTVPPFRELVEILFTMDLAEIWMLATSLPIDDRATPEWPLPEPSATQRTIQEVPRDPESFERHQWRFETRKRGLQESIERMQEGIEAEAAAAEGDAVDTLPLEQFVDRQRAETAAEIAAGYCGFPECSHCEPPIK